MTEMTDGEQLRLDSTETAPRRSVQRIVVPTGRLRASQIIVHLGSEAKPTHLYKKKNGTFVYWSPFTGERIVIRRPLRKLWEATAVRKLEARLEQSRRCPERESRHNEKVSA